MRLLPLIVLSLAAFGCHATEEEDSIDHARATRLVFTAFEDSFADDIDKMDASTPKSQLKKFSHEMFAFLKKVVPRGSEPTDAELKTMADKLAQSARAAADGYRSNSNITSEILKIVTNIEELSKAPEPVTEEQPSPSVFANAVRKIGGKYSNNSYVIAAFARCIFDEAKLLPVCSKSFSFSDKIWKILEKCDRKFGLGDLDVIDFLIPEMLETFSSERNSEVLVKGFSVLVRAIRNPTSYDSVEAFIENVKESKRLKAVGVLYREVKRCLPVEYDESSRMIDTSLNSLSPIMMQAFAEGEGPTQERLQKALVDFNTESDKYNQSTLLSLKQNALELERNFSNCILSEETESRLSGMQTALNGNEEDEATAPGRAKTKSRMYSAFMELVDEHMRALRNRVGDNEEDNEFISEVIETSSEWLGTDGTTEAGKAAMARMNEKLRNSFIHLSRDTKKLIVDHFPIRSAAILGAIF